ncbi:MAG: hypothetical protein ACI4D8_06535, partial [Wujia sp.]
MKRRIMAGILAGAMLLLLCACGKEEAKSEKTDGGIAFWGETGNEDKDDQDSQTESPTTTEATTEQIDSDKDIKITKNEAATVEFESFSNEYVNITIPKGWTVDIYNPEPITYMIRVYNPQNPNYCFAFQIYYDAIYKSQEAKDLMVSYYGGLYNQFIVCNPPNSSGFFGEALSMNNWGTDFSVIQDLGTSPLGGQIIQGTFTGANGEACDGLFTTTILDVGPYYVNENLMDMFSDQIDVMFLIASCTSMYYSPQGEFINWQPIMDSCLASLTFTEQFESDRKAAWNQVMQTSYQISQTYNEISDMIMESWYARETAHDIQVQKYCDTILGCERIYDSETGDVYLADIGWSNTYDGSRYELVTDDSYYTM